MNLIDSKINEISILLVVLNRFWATTSFWNCSSNHHITSSWTSPDRLKNQWNLSPFSCLEKVLKHYCFRNCISNHCISEIISNLVFLIHTLTLVAVLWIRFILIRIRIRGSDSDDHGCWQNLDNNSKFRNFLAFSWKKNFVDFLCLHIKNALNTQILKHLEEIS